MRTRLLPASSRLPKVPRGDGRTILVALLLFAMMALLAAIFTAVIPAPFSDRALSAAPDRNAMEVPRVADLR